MPSTKTKGRDPRVMIYAAFALSFAALDAAIITQLAPPLRGLGNIFWIVVALFALAGVGMLVRGKLGWRLAVGGCVTLLALEVVLLALILSSAAFLSGVYGSFGKGGAGMAVLFAFISIQAVAILPALQLKFLLTRAGRRAFGQEPNW